VRVKPSNPVAKGKKKNSGLGTIMNEGGLRTKYGEFWSTRGGRPRSGGTRMVGELFPTFEGVGTEGGKEVYLLNSLSCMRGGLDLLVDFLFSSKGGKKARGAFSAEGGETLALCFRINRKGEKDVQTTTTRNIL